MAKSSDGAAAPLLDYARNLYSKMASISGEDPSKPAGKEKVNEEAKRQTQKNDDDAVRQANESFRKVDAPKDDPRTKVGKPAPRKRAAAKRY